MSPSRKTEFSLEQNVNHDIEVISGLTYIPDYITVDEQKDLVDKIDQQEWSIRTQRRIQCFGYKYDFKDGSFISSTYLGNLPDWIQPLVNRIASDGLMQNTPDQVIVNEYQPGEGIVSHIDCIPCFGSIISILSLGSPCVMDFTHSQTKAEAKLLLQPRSLLVLQGAARYVWQHGIAACDREQYGGKEFVRTRRVSLTFREVLFPYK